MRKDERKAKLTTFEIERNEMISNVHYKIEKYFGVTVLHQGALRDRVTTLARGGWARMCQVGHSLQCKAVVSGGIKASVCAGSGLGTGGVWGMEMLIDIGIMGMILADN